MKTIVWLAAAILIGLVVLAAIGGGRRAPRGTPEPGAISLATVMLVAYGEEAVPRAAEGETQTGYGNEDFTVPRTEGDCGAVFVPVRIPVVSPRLKSVLAALSRFEPADDLKNPVKDNGLSVADARDGVVNLAGEPQLGGLCDRSVLRGQIEDTVRLYGDGFDFRLNGSAKEYRCMRDVWGKCG